MTMTQADIREHYEGLWKKVGDEATDASGLTYSNPVEDAVVTPIYRKLVSDLGIRVDGGRILDVGCGSGRWVRHLLSWYRPAALVGIDAAASAAELLARWHRSREDCRIEFRAVDVTCPETDLGERFDLINIANVLFHIPEQQLFMQALRNLTSWLNPGGAIVTTEYMPRSTMRTNWMMVRSRYEFEAALTAAGLRIAGTRAFGFFANDPMGLDGPDTAVRGAFQRVRSGLAALQSANFDAGGRAFVGALLADIERACLAFCAERVPDVDLPSQKLVALRRIDD